MRPFGFFVHHQGRGHAERCAALANALPPERPVTLFSARADIFPPLRSGIEVQTLPSLFEWQGPTPPPSGLAAHDTPETLHCAPLGWPGIRSAMAKLSGWCATADPELLIVDVSAEIAQLARICSVPHVCVLQHGSRSDPGHLAAYRGAVGLLAPYHEALAQPDWPDWMRTKTCFAGHVGALPHRLDKATARRRIGVAEKARLALVLTGGGGSGLHTAALGVGARATPDWQWITVGQIERDWHATEPGNLEHRGWVDEVHAYIAAADLVVSSTGNTTCHDVLAAGVPWLAIPEWRYFDEQVEKARALDRAKAAHVLPYLPSSAEAWREAFAQTAKIHCAKRQTDLAKPGADVAAGWLDALATRCWAQPSLPRPIAAE
ncbi:glycosyltransferase [Aestuariibius insulae]|uniref:glycosyltransferase n=1 Tax=Aestuariibius insulae TaxID=2058287 RepID=UPI00345EEB09